MSGCSGDKTIVVKNHNGNCILPIPTFKHGEALKASQWRCYNGGMYVACKDFDGSLTYPDSEYFKGPFQLEDLLNSAIKPCGDLMMALKAEIWEACSNDPRCVCEYQEGECAWDFDEEAEEYRLYTSLEDGNSDKPYKGSKKSSPTWDGGYTVCEYLNRQVGVDENGKPIKPGGTGCYISCSAVDNDDFRWVTDANGNRKLRVNIPGSPLCSLDWLTDYILPSDIVFGFSTKGSVSSPGDLIIDGAEHDITEQIVTKAELDAAGMRSTDNAVILRIDSSCSIVKPASVTGASALVSAPRIEVEDCGFRRRHISAVETAENQGATDQDDSRIDTFVAPLNADGSFKYIHAALADAADGTGLEVKSALKITGFKRIANSCYQAAPPNCVGIVGNP